MYTASKRLATEEGLQAIADAIKNTETVQMAKAEIQAEGETQVANVQAAAQEITGKVVQIQQNTDDVAELKGDLVELQNDIFSEKKLTVIKGGINRANGFNTLANNRLKTSICYAKKGDLIYVNQYDYSVFFYDNKYTYIGNTYDNSGRWYTPNERYKFDRDCLFTVVIRKDSNESDFTESECYSISNNSIILYRANQENVDGILFENGHIETSFNSDLWSKQGNDYKTVPDDVDTNYLVTTRWRTSDIRKFYKGAKISILTGYRIYVFKYLDDGTVVNGSWITEEYIFNETVNARIVLDKTNGVRTNFKDWIPLNEILTIKNKIALKNEFGELIALTEKNTYSSGDGLSANGKRKNFSLSAITDLHGSKEQFYSFINNTNDIKDYLDCSICLGDTVAQNPNSDFSFYEVSKFEIPFLYTVGNHDVADYGSVGISQDAIFDKYIKPLVDNGFVSTNKSYYYKDFSNYKIRIISLFEYEGSVETSFANSDHYRRYMTSEQLQWFADTLYSTPNDYSVIVLTHQIVHENPTIIDSKFTELSCYRQINDTFTDGFGYQLDNINGNPIGDIVNAFITSANIEKTYTNNTTNEKPSSVVSKDFSNRIKGKFICYLSGHTHAPFIVKTQYDQLNILLPSGSSNMYQRKADDIRPNGDNYYILSFDTENKLVKLLKVGNRETNDMRLRDYMVINY